MQIGDQFEQRQGQETIPSNSLEFSCELENHQLVILLNLNDLKRNLVETADEVGIDPAAVTAFFKKLHIAFVTETEFVDQQSGRETKDPGSQRIRRKNNSYATVNPNPDGTVDLVFFTDQLSTILDQRQNHPHFEVPANIPEEAKVFFMLDALNTIWKHERQHLLQLLVPEKASAIQEYLDKKAKFEKLNQLVVADSLLVAAGLFLVNALQHEQLFIPALSFFTFLALTQTGKNWYLNYLYRNSEFEIDAFSQMNKPESITSPFSATLEPKFA